MQHPRRSSSSWRSGLADRPAPAATAIAAAVLASAFSACGGGTHKQQVTSTTTITSKAATVPQDEILSLSGLGIFEGRCPRGARSWTLRFVVRGASATDTVSYRVGTGPRHTVNVDPGRALTIHLVPGATKTHEPADRFVPPVGQGRGRAGPATVPTTQPLQALIYQGTEPQTLRADVRIALAAIGGETGQCVLVGSTVNAYTYPN
jgi:hypothetical protein